jgi:7,8-dihydropterin-6-yl-methyl-4-(beta-D-ribofuranosyl)aminobenzene 5'-phosphate synthase
MFSVGHTDLRHLQTVTQGDKKHSLLFDTGPEEEVWERNATRLELDAGAIEHIHLSHWHRDHSGGILKAISMINAQKAPSQPKVVVDVHPNRPEFRGVKTPRGQIISLEPDPTFDDIKAAGGVLSKNDQVHTVLSDTFLVSGAIPRVTEYETGIAGGMRYDTTSKEWASDGLIMDERLVLCNIKGELNPIQVCSPKSARAKMVTRKGSCRLHRLQPCWRGQRRQAC